MTHENMTALDARLQLLDHQVVDRDGEMVCNIDDLELTTGDDHRFHVSAILTGPGALGPRWGGRTGGWMTAVWRRLRPESDPEPGRIPWSEAIHIDSAVHISARRRDLDVEGLETWLGDHLITRLPGARHDSDQ